MLKWLYESIRLRYIHSTLLSRPSTEIHFVFWNFCLKHMNVEAHFFFLRGKWSNHDLWEFELRGNSVTHGSELKHYSCYSCHSFSSRTISWHSESFDKWAGWGNPTHEFFSQDSGRSISYSTSKVNLLLCFALDWAHDSILPSRFPLWKRNSNLNGLIFLVQILRLISEAVEKKLFEASLEFEHG